MNPAHPSISAHKLRVIKNKKIILNDIDIRVKPGSITGLIGPSGSGKTTLMRVIVGVQAYASGTVTILDQPAGHKKLRKTIGYVTQSPAVYGDLTVEQNLRYFATIVKASHDQVNTIIDAVRLSEQRKQIVDSLSGGQRARVSLAVALLGDPELLVLDEPTVGLDPVLRQELWALFADLASSGKTLLISSHVMDEAERCDNLILLREGKVLWNDTRAELLSTEKVRDVGSAFVAMIEKADR